jgi:hypothetical protein
VDLANLVFEPPPGSRGSAIQTDFCRPSADSEGDSDGFSEVIVFKVT